MSLVSTRALVLALAALRFAAAEEFEDSQATTLDAPIDAVVSGHLFPACNGHRVGGKKYLNVPVDRCLTTPGFGLEIKTAAVCANGTRAQWARFENKKCGYGTLSEKYGLVEIKDADIGAESCLETGVIGAEEKISSVAFWCDGVKKSSPEDEPKKPENPDKSKKGSVSESACMVGKAPTFNHPKTDTCVNLRTEKMKIYSAGICENGTQSTLALYEDKGCVGTPATFLEIKEENARTCMDLSGTSSFAFYCTGEGLGEDSAITPNPGQPRQGGSILGFFLILTLICMMFFLMLVLSIYTWVRKYGGSVGKLVDFAKGLLKPKEGAIAI